MNLFLFFFFVRKSILYIVVPLSLEFDKTLYENILYTIRDVMNYVTKKKNKHCLSTIFETFLINVGNSMQKLDCATVSKTKRTFITVYLRPCRC